MNHPLVSVIIPNYCHSRFLDERITSVLNQTYQNFEIIILDDCSPDNGASKAVIEKYRNNPKVSHIVYNEENSGSTFNQWNKGFSLAKGELIWIAESDDSCGDILLQKLIAEFNADENCVLAFCGSLKIDIEGRPFKHNKPINIPKHWNGIEFIKEYLSLYNIICNASSAVFKKEIAVSIDTVYTHYKGAGDQLFWMEICEQGNVAVVNEQINRFRQHGNNTTSKCNSSGTNFKELKYIHEYLKGKQYFSIKEEKRMRQRIINDILSTHFENNNIKTEIIHLWKPSWIMLTKGYIAYCCRLFKEIIKLIIRY